MVATLAKLTQVRDGFQRGKAVASVTHTMTSIQDLLASRRNPTVPLPRLDPTDERTAKHFQYASYIAAGIPHNEACTILGFNPQTVKRWRSELVAEARAHYGFEVDYMRVAIDVVDAEYARVQCEPSTSSLSH